MPPPPRSLIKCTFMFARLVYYFRHGTTLVNEYTARKGIATVVKICKPVSFLPGSRLHVWMRVHSCLDSQFSFRRYAYRAVFVDIKSFHQTADIGQGRNWRSGLATRAGALCARVWLLLPLCQGVCKKYRCWVLMISCCTLEGDAIRQCLVTIFRGRKIRTYTFRHQRCLRSLV